MIKYINIFTNLQGEEIALSIDIDGYSGEPITFDTVNESPVRFIRNGDIYGIAGGAAVVRCFVDGNINVADFLVNDTTDCTLTIQRDGNTEFIGAIVLDDVTTALRAEPYELELTFTDNLGLLADIEAPFIIDNEFTVCVSVIRDLLAQTGLDLPLNIIHLPFPEDDESGSFEQFKILPRTFAKSLREFDRSKDALNKLLQAFRCRLFQHNGEWYIIRTHDYLYQETTVQGWRYDGSNIGVETEYTLGTNSGLIPLQFSQQVVYKRPVKTVKNRYNFDAGFQLFNADLQELGALVSTTVVGDTTVERYNIPDYWFLDGITTAFIEVVYDTATDTEIDRYLLIPYLSASGTSADGFRFNKILVSKDDTFNCTVNVRASSDSNFAFRFRFQCLLEGASGQNYLLNQTLIPNLANSGWTPTAETPATAFTIRFEEFAGGVDMTEPQPVELTRRLPLQNPLMFPEDGFLTFKIAGFKNTDSRLADSGCKVDNIEFAYEFLVNKKTSIEAQEHTSENDTESKAIREEALSFDQSIKFNPIGQLYAEDNTILGKWDWPEGGGDTIAIGELNNREELRLFGAPKKQVDGIFQGITWPGEVVGFDGTTWLPLSVDIDYRRGDSVVTMLDLSENTDINYTFDYIYKVRS